MLRVLWEVGFGGGFVRGFGGEEGCFEEKVVGFGGIDFAVSV